MSSPPPFDDDDDVDDVDAFAFDSTPRLGGSGRAVPDVPPQLARSRALVNEGLEGLPNRAVQLIILGSTFWLGIPALIALIVSVGASAALYSQLGDRFVHGGTPADQRLRNVDATRPLDALDPNAWAPEDRIP